MSRRIEKYLGYTIKRGNGSSTTIVWRVSKGGQWYGTTMSPMEVSTSA